MNFEDGIAMYIHVVLLNLQGVPVSVFCPVLAFGCVSAQMTNVFILS